MSILAHVDRQWARRIDSMPKYLLLLHEPPDAMPADISPEEIQAIIQHYADWRTKVAQAGKLVDGQKLRDGEGRVVRRGGTGTTVTDGPYAEAREVIGGLFIIEAASYDETVALCQDCPHLDFGAIEVREIEPT
jgi:hypothetical protein